MKHGHFKHDGIEVEFLAYGEMITLRLAQALYPIRLDHRQPYDSYAFTELVYGLFDANHKVKPGVSVWQSRRLTCARVELERDFTSFLNTLSRSKRNTAMAALAEQLITKLSHAVPRLQQLTR